MTGIMKRALSGLRGDSLRAQRHSNDRGLMIRIGLAEEEPEEEEGATFPNDLVEPRRTEFSKLTQHEPYDEEDVDPSERLPRRRR